MSTTFVRLTTLPPRFCAMQSMAQQQGAYQEEPAPVAGDPVSTARSLPFLHHSSLNPTIIALSFVIILLLQSWAFYLHDLMLYDRAPHPSRSSVRGSAAAYMRLSDWCPMRMEIHGMPQLPRHYRSPSSLSPKPPPTTPSLLFSFTCLDLPCLTL